MFIHTVPAVGIILMFVVSVFTLDITIFWLIVWWITGCLCAIVLTYVKGETFGGGIWYLMGIAIIGCLGFCLLPFGVVAIPFAIILLPKKWKKEMEAHDQRICQWAKAGYPMTSEYNDLIQGK